LVQTGIGVPEYRALASPIAGQGDRAPHPEIPWGLLVEAPIAGQGDRPASTSIRVSYFPRGM